MLDSAARWKKKETQILTLRSGPQNAIKAL